MQVAEKYAFTGGAITTDEADAVSNATSATSPAARAAQQAQQLAAQQAQQVQQALQPRNTSNIWAMDPWGHGLNASAAVPNAAFGNGTNATAGGNATTGLFGGWHPGEAFNSAAWNPSMYHPPEVPSEAAAFTASGAAGAGSGAGGASSDD